MRIKYLMLLVVLASATVSAQQSDSFPTDAALADSATTNDIDDDLTVAKMSYSGTPKKYTIADIEIVGVENLDKKILINLSGLKVGQTITVPGDDISQAARRYWNHGLFSSVKIYQSKVVGRDIYLQIKLVERPRLSEINFYGLKRSEVDDVDSKVAMMKGSQVTPFMITRAKKYVTNYFVDKGFYNTEVTIIQRNDANNPNQVILDITVDKKEKVKVRELNISGNTVMSYRKLNRAMKKTNAKKLYNFFRTKKFVKEKYEEDLGNLIEIGRAHV